MKKILKVIFSIILLVVILISIVFIFRNKIIKFTVSAGVHKITGLRLDIAKLNVGISETMVSIQGMKLYNPAGYEDRLMVDMPEIYVDYNLAAILKNNIHLPKVVIDLKEVVVVKNKEGILNIESLNVVKESKEKKDSQTQPDQDTKKTDFKIDYLQLKIGRVLFKDYSKGTPPSVTEYKLNIDNSYNDITDPKALARLILVRALVNTNISKIANFDIKNLESMTTGIAGTLGEGTKGITEKTTETIKKFLPFGN
ncbi:MAG: AsmA family protein [Candidatus Omnitrophica bacterium]|nr:AsmA family protein [Candidatus Omnitrophota bacterium]